MYVCVGVSEGTKRVVLTRYKFVGNLFMAPRMSIKIKANANCSISCMNLHFLFYYIYILTNITSYVH